MANCCHFLMKIAGREDAVQEFIRMLQWKEEFASCGLGRVQDFEVDEDTAEYSEHNRALYSVEGQGDCDWSLKIALQDYQARSLLNETARLGLVVEAFSSEPGGEFQEHLFIDRGKLLIEDCVDYEEYMVDGAEERQIQELMQDKGLSREQLMAAVNCNGDYCVGGFSNFGSFRDLFPYLLSMQLQLNAKWGESYIIYPYMSNYYENNNLFLGLAYFDKEAKDIVSFSDVTVNAGRLPYLHGALNSFVVEESLVDFLVDNGFGQLTGEHLHTGFSTYPIFRFNEDKLQQISAIDYAEYAKANGQRVWSQSAPLIKKIHDAEGKAGHRSGPEKFLPPEPER